MVSALRWFTVLFGVVCCMIALVHIVIGPGAIPGSIPVNATMDSEDRFYATLFFGFGVALIWAAQDLRVRRRLFFALLGVFFVGGIARIGSWLAVGPPIPLFVFLGALELTMPPVLWAWHRRTYPSREREA